jgi:hypothetical protein
MRSDRARVSAALPASVFALGPEATVARLAEPPNVPAALAALVAIGSGAIELDAAKWWRL